MSTETPAASPAAKIKITVTEETTATYLVTLEWLKANGYPTTSEELSDRISGVIESVSETEGPLDNLALKLEEDAENTLSEYAVTERDLYIDSAE